jgi:hypothetical protein
VLFVGICDLEVTLRGLTLSPELLEEEALLWSRSTSSPGEGLRPDTDL